MFRRLLTKLAQVRSKFWRPSYAFILVAFLLPSTILPSVPGSPIQDKYFNGSPFPPLLRPAEVERDSAHGFNVLSYYLQVRVDSAGPGFTGNLRISLAAGDTGISDITLMANNLTIYTILDSATMIALSYDYDPSAGSLIVHLHPGLAPYARTACYIDYTYTSWTRRGYYYYGPVNHTTGEPYDGRYWLPSYDLPGDKALYSVAITVPPGNLASANGTLDSIGDAGLGWRTWHWSSRDSMATYLMCFNWGNLAIVSDTAHPAGRTPVPIMNFVNPADTQKARIDFARTAEMIEYYSNLFGTFAFEKYGHTVVEPFTWNGMEHQTLTTLHRRNISGYGTADPLIAHELSHHWWGDALTPLTFQHVWLNEGFATWSEYMWQEHHNGLTAAQNRRGGSRSSYLSEWNGGAHYSISNPPQPYYFGAAIYQKGGMVLNMLRRQMGDSLFFQAMRSYFIMYYKGHVTTPEWAAVMSFTAGTDLSWFFNQWVYGQGHPVIDYAWATIPTDSGYALRIQLRQTQTLGESLFLVPVKVRYYITEYRDTVLWMNARTCNYQFPIPGSVVTFAIDPEADLCAEFNESVFTSIEEPVKPTGGLSVHPNPIAGIGRIHYSLISGATNELRLVDLTGRVVWRRWVSGSGEVPWPVVTAGVYQVVLGAERRGVVVK